MPWTRRQSDVCLLIVLARVVPGLPLVVAANRDERLDRPATPMVILRAAGPRILGGRDEVEGGTWLAVNEFGVVAGLTNRPSNSGRDPSKRSRGELPMALTTRASAAEAIERDGGGLRPDLYNPAWLLVGDRTSLVSIDMTDPARPGLTWLAAGIYVLENRPLGEPSAKIERVTRLLAGVEGLAPEDVIARLWAALGDHEVPMAPIVEGPAADRRPDTSSMRPPALDAACVHLEEYGTRWSAMILVAEDPSIRPAFWYTDGPSCVAERQDASWLWEA